MRRDKNNDKDKPFKMGPLTSDFLFDEGGRQRKIKKHHKRGKGTRFIKKLLAGGLMAAALMMIPLQTYDTSKTVYHDGVFDTPPTSQSSLTLPVNDPLFQSQWHLKNTGQDGGTVGVDINIVPAWKDYTGQGCKISVFELEDALVNHPEIEGYADVFGNTHTPDDVSEPDEDEKEKIVDRIEHATNVANIAAGRANNFFGGVGAAPNALVTSYGGTTVENFREQVDHDVVNASWMYINFFANNQLNSKGEDAAWYKALKSTIEDGRHGRGTIWLVAAGNDFLRGHNTNYSGFANNRFVSVIAAIDKNGQILNASSPGANVIGAAPGHDIVMSPPNVSPDVTGNPKQTGSGTSYATPQASGVECLMLEANPYLGYRDARMILALSARQTDKGHATWRFNHASNWNGGRMHVSDRFGYGLIDAHAMVRLAETWQHLNTLENEANIGLADKTEFDIPDNGSITRDFDLSQQPDIDLTDAQLRINIEHPRMGDLLVELISPSGTVSKLIQTPEQGKFTGHTDREDGTFTAFDKMDYVLGSVQFMGEKANGKWQVRITDTAEGETGHVKMLDLQLYGNEKDNNNQYVFTNEFADLGSEFERQSLKDDNGGHDRINASPVTTDTKIDMESGVSEIAGQELHIQPHTIEDIILGDGNDITIGSSQLNNIFLPGRGDDVTDAKGGKNLYYYRDGDGHDNYTPSPSGKDRIFLLRGITPENTLLTRRGNGLEVTFKDKTGSIYMGDYFTPGTRHKISAVSYPDGSFLRMTDDVKKMIGTSPKSVAEIGTEFGEVPKQTVTPQEKPRSLLSRLLDRLH